MVLTQPTCLQGPEFAQVLIDWQKQHGRHTLPWQNTGDPYRVWLSEVMLQQTQVATVIGYYERFLKAFPTVVDLANAPADEVMRLWAGLGYYSRARNLHACAQQVVQRFQGEFPADPEQLETLPGIGRSTAGAIASLALGVSAPILDGNVKRVFCRYYGVSGYPESTAIKKRLWLVAEANVPQAAAGTYNQALMDLGATVCLPKNPQCARCPLRLSCKALAEGATHILPSPKPKKPVPNLYFHCEVIRDSRGALNLTHYEGKGVWQGLWMFPMKPIDEQEAKQYPVNEWVVHVLTHRRLYIRPTLIQLAGESKELEFAEQKALPKVVSKIVAFLMPKQ